MPTSPVARIAGRKHSFLQPAHDHGLPPFQPRFVSDCRVPLNGAGDKAETEAPALESSGSGQGILIVRASCAGPTQRRAKNVFSLSLKAPHADSGQWGRETRDRIKRER